MRNKIAWGIGALLLVLSAGAVGEVRADPVSPSEVKRIPAAEARAKAQAGTALLVCAYDGDAKFEAMRIEGAISWSALKKRLPSLDKRTEIILYCA